MRGRRGFVVAVAVLALVGCSPPSASHAATRETSAVRAPDRAFVATVDRVVDGDTFIALVRGARVRVRLIGVDSPESVRPGYPVECWGHEASAVLTRLLPAGTRVRAAYQAGGRLDRGGGAHRARRGQRDQTRDPHDRPPPHATDAAATPGHRGRSCMIGRGGRDLDRATSAEASG